MTAIFKRFARKASSSLQGALALAAILPLCSCGKTSDGGATAPAHVGQVQGAFQAAAHTSGVPVRFLMAVGYLESRLVPANATANYASTDSASGDQQTVPRGTVMTETAFGLTFAELGLDPAKDESQLLETQIDAYARWLATKVQGLNLAASPRTADDKFSWIQNLSLQHRRGISNRRNVQAIFSRELIDVLNNGFIWQDPRNGEKLELTPEKPVMTATSMPSGQAWLTLNADDGTQNIAPYLPLATMPSEEFKNKPRRVEVIHCPLSLSGCLELQTGMEDQDASVHLAAHYVVPAVDAGAMAGTPAIPSAYQVAPLSDVVIVTNKLGVHQPVNDAIVVMLTGNSGRLVDGKREPANPTWMSDLQLRHMGDLINHICTLLSMQKVDENHPQVNLAECLATSGDNGVQFRRQDAAEEARWGDIPDFDPTIFGAYVTSPGGLPSDVSFQFAGNKRRYNKSDAIPLTVLFNNTVQSVQIERMRRCQNGKLVWEKLDGQDIRGQRKYSTNKRFYDSGPNRNGEQFFRARVYDKDSHLIGWAVDRIVLANFEPDATFASDDLCVASVN